MGVGPLSDCGCYQRYPPTRMLRRWQLEFVRAGGRAEGRLLSDFATTRDYLLVALAKPPQKTREWDRPLRLLAL